MKEDLLHFIWRYQLFSNQTCQTTSGQQLQIIYAGVLNEDAGPDFFYAKLKIGETTWVGNVEIHLKSSDWYAHKHQNDSSYDNVILHVVYEHNQEVFGVGGVPIPCLELKQLISKQLFQDYDKLRKSSQWIACESSLKPIHVTGLKMHYSRLAIERLQEKVHDIEVKLEKSKGDWEQVTYQLLMKVFGQVVNQQPYEMLSKYAGLKCIRKLTSVFQIEAVLFGCSGLLKPVDEYSQALHEEFRYLQKKFDLEVMDAQVWKFMRMRPASFPTIRIAQLAAWLGAFPKVFRYVVEEPNLKSSIQSFLVAPNEYWTEHYNFGKRSQRKPKSISASFLNHIYINAFIPLLFHYGESTGNDGLVEKSLRWLQELKVEENKIIRNYSSLGMLAENALESQALIQLYKMYCKPKKCLNCSIGYKILRNS